MKKLILIIFIIYCLPSIILGQEETYTIRKAPFSSDKYDEFSPVYYRDGIVFCTNRNSNFLNYSTAENKGLIKINYIDTVRGENWRNARLFSKNLKSKFNDGPVTFNSRGDTIYFSRNLEVDGSLRDNSNPRNKLGIFTASLEGTKWIKITDLRFNTEWYNITTPYLSPDGKMLFFASDNPEGYGGTDLYYSRWRGNFWDDPVNLGPTVNTSGNESYPFVNFSGGLFFSSDGHPGYGGKDIFYTRFSNSLWLPPVRLDPPVNSQYDDFAIIADSTMSEGYFSSNRGNNMDIYHYQTNYHQLFYCDNQRTNEYCFKFTDDSQIKIDNSNLQYEWNFGDGSKATGLNVEHCFPGPGNYNIRLYITEKKTGRIFFTKLIFDLDLREIEQPVINSPLTAIVGDQVKFDGLTSHFPGSIIINSTWNFGDGDRATGEIINHSFKEKGEYEVKLGLMLKDRKTKVMNEACAVKKIVVFENAREKLSYESKLKSPAPKNSIFNYDHADILNLYSAENEIDQDLVFQVEIVTSKTKLNSNDNTFKNVPVKYSIKEVKTHKNNLFSYVIAEEMNLMAVYPAFREIIANGYSNAVIKTFILEDPAAKELHTLKKVFGVSTDNFFRKNDYNLASAGTQFLDLILGFMVKYPALKLEIAVHTDNLGQAKNNLYLSQRRAGSMVNYLIINGVNRDRLIAKGFGGTKPIASNILEADRRLNRRIDFNIVR